MIRIVVAFLLGLVATGAAAQVKQSGNVTPTHATAWTTNGTVQDAGTATSPYITTLGVLNGTGSDGICVQSAASTAAGYQRFCMGATTSGGALLSTQNFGTASAQGISLNLNGSPAAIPAVVTPTVSGHGACFNNTTGTLIDCGFSPNGSTNIDVYLAIGSSNTVGSGDNVALAPVPQSNALMYCYTGSPSGSGIQPLTEPVCSAVSNAALRVGTGGLFAAFSIAYARPVMIVMTAVDAATQSTACDLGTGGGNWQDTGPTSNYTLSLTAINAALTALTAAGYTPQFRGIYQGDLGTNDAIKIDSATCLLSDYTTAFAQMAARYRAATIGGTVYPHLPIYMALISQNTGLAEFPGYAAVRSAQQNIVNNDGNTLLPYTNLPSFGVRGLIQAASVHPTQPGYNEWGYAMGGAILPYVPGSPKIQYINQQPSVAPPLPPFSSTLLMMEGADSKTAAVVLDSYGGQAIYLARVATGTGASPTATQNGANIGIFAARGYGATGYSTVNNGSLLWTATQNWTDANQGVSASLFVAANNTATPALALFADQDRSIKLPLYGAGIAHFDSSGKISSSAISLTADVTGVLPVANGGTNCSVASITCFNNITGFSAAGTTGTTSTNLVFSTSPTLVTPVLGVASATSLTAANVYGGSAAGSTLNLQSTSNGSPSGDSLTLTTGGSVRTTVLSNGNIGFGTETNPQYPFTFNLNSSTGLSLVTGTTGPVLFGPASTGNMGFHAIAFAGNAVNSLERIDGTAASPSNLGSGEIVGTLQFGGWGNGALRPGQARILGTTTEAWTTTFGASLEFDTTVAGGSRAQAMLIKAGVIVGTGTTDPGAGNLIAGGTIEATGVFRNNGSAGLSVTKTVRASGGAADCTLIYTGGILTGGSC